LADLLKDTFLFFVEMRGVRPILTCHAKTEQEKTKRFCF